MEQCEACWVREPAALRGRWLSLMPEAKEIHLEIGCGKGRFTVETAKANPEVLFLAIEKVADAMVIAMERAQKEGLTNVFFLETDAAKLSEIFAAGEIHRIYLNFSDPWPSKGHAKRRLTHGNFLRRYREVLAEGGALHVKTDNDPLFEFSLGEIPQFGFALSEVTRDLHADGPCGIMTDYEQKFYADGITINRCVATMVPWEEPKKEETAE